EPSLLASPPTQNRLPRYIARSRPRSPDAQHALVAHFWLHYPLPGFVVARLPSFLRSSLIPAVSADPLAATACERSHSLAALSFALAARSFHPPSGPHSL